MQNILSAMIGCQTGFWGSTFTKDAAQNFFHLRGEILSSKRLTYPRFHD